MRSPHGKSLLIGLVCAALASSLGGGVAEAQKKKDAPAKKDAPKEAPKDAPKEGVEEGEIEMGGDEAPPAEGGVQEGEIEMGGEEAAPEPSLEADTAATTGDSAAVKASTAQLSPTRLSWQDIVVVIRKPFLKVRRAELQPFVATTMNDNIVRHYSVGGQFNYYLTDVLAIGVEGQYYQDQFREPFDLIARQARRLPTVNKYNYSGALNFSYVPIYGKFAVLDKHIITWESALTAGIGATQSEVIPRDTKFPGFTSILITPSVGASMRFFLFKWLTVNFAVRDYVFIDQFEPTNRGGPMNENVTAEEAKKNADTSLVNNVMFQIGVSFWLPTSFEYTTFR